MNPILTHLSRVIEKCEKATPGPWVNEDYRDKGNWRSTGLIWSFDEELNKYAKTICRIEQGKLSSVSPDSEVEAFEANAEFIAQARTSLPQLAKALQVAIDRLDRISREKDFVSGVGWRQSPVGLVAETTIAEISTLLGLAGEGK